MKIGLVQPTFTAAAYNNAFYVFYNKYYYAHTSPVVCWSCVQSLYATVPDISTWAQDMEISPALTFYPIVTSLRPNDTVELLTDQDIDGGAAQYHDVLMLFHQEYLTQQEYTNIRNFVNSGGKLIAMCGNVFFAEVEYAEPATTVTDSNHIRLVSGHYWIYGGSNVAQQTPSIGERWAPTTLDWFGSNSDSGPTIYKYAYLYLKFNNNPWGYPAGTSGCENQYIPKSALSKVNVLLDFKAVYSYPTNFGSVVVYEKTYGAGKILCYSIVTYQNQVQSSPAFQSYFASSLNRFLDG